MVGDHCDCRWGRDMIFGASTVLAGSNPKVTKRAKLMVCNRQLLESQGSCHYGREDAVNFKLVKASQLPIGIWRTGAGWRRGIGVHLDLINSSKRCMFLYAYMIRVISMLVH